MVATPARETHEGRVFLFLVAYRWASLLPALWLVLLALRQGSESPVGVTLVLAVGSALLISAFYRPLNRLLRQVPLLLGIDLLFSAGLLAFSGGVHSPFYLYALGPLLAGAFFFRVRGALIGAAAFTPLYLLAQGYAWQAPMTAEEINLLATQLLGIWLLPLLVSYPSVLIRELEEARAALSQARDDLQNQNHELARSHRQLKIIHDLTLLLQSAPDVLSVQERVLTAVTRDFGFPRAAVGLVTPGNGQLGGWRRLPSGNGPAQGAPSPELALTASGGPLIQGLLAHQPARFPAGSPVTGEPHFDRWLGAGPWFSFPLNLREHAVGMLLVATTDGSLSEEQHAILDVVASQAAVSLGTTMLCIDRARNLAVEQERNRIARDIHDTVAQSLFGVVFSLDACIDMLPDQAGQVQAELVELRDLASRVRDEVRSSIFDLWPTELNLERFKSDLRSYAAQCCRPQMFHVDFEIQGEFDRLAPRARQALYRVAQEGLANAARHSGAHTAQVAMRLTEDQVLLEVSDPGRGFNPEQVMAQARDRERFGLLGVRERVEGLGGRFEILSKEGQGTRLSVRLPLQGDGPDA